MAREFKVNSLEGLFLLKNGQYWNDSKKSPEKGDILLRDGKIEKIGNIDLTDGAKEIDLNRAIVFPGLIDIHVHLREPGFEDRETIATGCAAAAAGGFTAVCSMPNTDPVTDNQEVVRFIKEQARDLPVEVYPVGAVSKGSKGEALAEIGFMREAGAVGISDDGLPVRDSGLMRLALEYAQRFNMPVMQHAQDESLTDGGSMNEGVFSTKYGLRGWPAVAEDVIVARDSMIADYTNGHLHVQHISTAGAVELVRQAKAKGINVTAEATPHHFTLTDEILATYDTNFKMNPPLRGSADVAAVIEGLKDGTIDAIATDHAPHVIDDKDKEFDQAAFGVTGLETAVGLYFSELGEKHGFSLEQFVDLLVINPRKILNIDIPVISEGADAELSIIDPEAEWIYDVTETFSKGRNSCFDGRALKGRPMGVASKGKIWWQNTIIK